MAACKKEVKEQAKPKDMCETLMLFGRQQKQGGENPRGRLGRGPS
jgi:hypothetical protein